MKRFNKILQLRRHTKLKRFSRSATSVVLAVCLLISCMTVGLIATDAAKVTGEKVGSYNNYYIEYNSAGSGTAYFNSSGVAEIVATETGTMYLGFKRSDWGTDGYFGHDSYTISPGTTTWEVYQYNTNWIGMSVTKGKKYTFQLTSEGGTTKFKVTESDNITKLSAPSLKYNNATTTPVDITGSSANLTWANVSNASSYTVYKDGTAVKTNATSPYTANSTGSYTVKAIGDGTTYSDSDASNAIQLNFLKTTIIFIKSGLKNKGNKTMTNAHIWSNTNDNWTGDWPGEAISGWTAAGDYYYKSFTNAYDSFKIILQGNSAQTDDSDSYDTGKTYRIDSVDSSGTNGKAVLTEGAPTAYAITYSGSNVTWGSGKPTTAYANNTVSFTVSANSGYRLSQVKYNDGSDHVLTASNGTYSFTMPAKAVTVTATTVKTYTVTLTADTGIDTKQYKLGSSGTYADYSSALTVDTDTDVYFKVTYSTGYEYNTNSGLTIVTANTVFKTGSVTENKSVSITAKKTNYTVTLNKNADDATAGTASVTATYGDAMPTTSVNMPTRTGYTFEGYYDTDAASGGTQYYTSAGASARTWNKTSNTTLYARWTMITGGAVAKAYTSGSASSTGGTVKVGTSGTAGATANLSGIGIADTSYNTVIATKATYYDFNGWQFTEDMCTHLRYRFGTSGDWLTPAANTTYGTSSNTTIYIKTDGSTGITTSNAEVHAMFTPTTYTGLSTEAKYSTTGASGSYNTTMTYVPTKSSASGTNVDGITVTAESTKTEGGASYQFYKWSCDSADGTFASATSASTTFKPKKDNAKAIALYKKIYTFSNGTTDTHGTVTVPSGNKVAGDSYSGTVTPADGYKIKTLTVGGVAVSAAVGQITEYTYSGTTGSSTTGTTSPISVVATFEANASMNLYIAGRFRVRPSNGANSWTTTYSGSDDWNATSTSIPFTYVSGTKYKVDTYASLAELSAQIGSSTYTDDPVFFVYDTTNSKNWYATSATTMNTTKTTLVSDGGENYNLKFDSDNIDNPVTIFYDTNTHKIWYTVPDFYDVTVASVTGGSMTASPTRATSETTIELTATPSTGYQLSGVTTSPNVTVSISGNSCTFTMPASDITVTPVFSKIDYSLNGVTNPADNGTVTFYSDSACQTQITTAQYQDTFYAKYTEENGYVLKNFSINGTGASIISTSGNVATCRMGSANVTVTANVMLQHSVTYYVDMHGNNMTGKKVQVAIVTGSTSTTPVTDNNDDPCSALLEQVGNSSIYSADITTPVVQSGANYNNVYVRVTYGTYSGSSFTRTDFTQVTSLDGVNKVPGLIASHTMWMEAINESSVNLKYTTGTTVPSPVADGFRRIYLAKPYGWQTSETSWENIGIYYWGNNTQNIGWDSNYNSTTGKGCVHMNPLGYDSESGYRYYYADIPKNITETVSDVTSTYKVHSLIFQGWGTNESNDRFSKTQTDNIDISNDSTNYFMLTNESGYSAEKQTDAVIPSYTKRYSNVTANVTESATINIAPTYKGAKIKFTSSNTNVATVGETTGVVTPHASGTTTITVKIYGTIGDLVRSHEDTDHKDYLTYTTTVTIHDPEKFERISPMSLATSVYTVVIPQVSSGSNIDQPGYFDLSGTSVEVTGLANGAKSSAIIERTGGTEQQPTAYNVIYAKNTPDYFPEYDSITLTGTTVTKSFAVTGSHERYGLQEWKLYPGDDSPSPAYIMEKSIANSSETVITSGIAFSDTYTIYKAIFEKYEYVDVTFSFTYYEYNPQKVDVNETPLDDSDDMINYPYDADWADEDNTNNNYANSHIAKTLTVSGFEVRGKTADTVTASDLIVPAVQALKEMPSNNYYRYTIDTSSISISNPNTTDHTADAAVTMNSQVQTYSVYLNGSLMGDDYTYQAYANLTPSGLSTETLWFAVDSGPNDQTYGASASTSNAPLLATGSSYKFRVKGDTYLRTVAGSVSEAAFNRSEVDFSHYEITHRDKTVNNTTTKIEYLLQNFYIADFFSPDKVFATRPVVGSNTLETYKPEEPQFVGGGVVYYSMTNDTPSQSALDSDYVNNQGTVNVNNIKEMIKANIEKNIVSGAVPENDTSAAAEEISNDEAMMGAYGTEIAAQQNVENGQKTGIIYRYKPLNTYETVTRTITVDGETQTVRYLKKKEDGNYVKELNNNTFRYSNSLQSYQYVYASGNENKATNSGKNMRLYSYYVYSYVAYNQETNVPETRYEVVLSDNYADASTYWEGNPNPNPNS